MQKTFSSAVFTGRDCPGIMIQRMARTWWTPLARQAPQASGIRPQARSVFSNTMPKNIHNLMSSHLPAGTVQVIFGVEEKRSFINKVRRFTNRLFGKPLLHFGPCFAHLIACGVKHVSTIWRRYDTDLSSPGLRACNKSGESIKGVRTQFFFGHSRRNLMRGFSSLRNYVAKFIECLRVVNFVRRKVRVTMEAVQNPISANVPQPTEQGSRAAAIKILPCARLLQEQRTDSLITVRGLAEENRIGEGNKNSVSVGNVAARPVEREIHSQAAVKAGIDDVLTVFALQGCAVDAECHVGVADQNNFWAVRLLQQIVLLFKSVKVGVGILGQKKGQQDDGRYANGNQKCDLKRQLFLRLAGFHYSICEANRMPCLP